MPSVNTDGGTLLTVAAGTTWEGYLSLAATAAVAVGGSSITRYPHISVSGGGGRYADGDILLSLALLVPSVAGTALVGATTSGAVSISKLQVQAGPGNAVLLVLTLGASVAGVASAAGQVL